jgi:hypothetical protein
MKKGRVRRTLSSCDLDLSPEPRELYDKLMSAKGWNYQNAMDRYLARDRALVSILYVGQLRVSEAIPLKKNQFKRLKDHVQLSSILLAKRKPGKLVYRSARLPLRGERAKFTKLILDYLDLLEPDERLFPFSLTKRTYYVKGRTYKTREGSKPIRSVVMMGTKRAWQIVNALLPEYTEHWLRMFGEDYLYTNRDHDILAVADEVKVDARTLQGYLRKQHLKYPAA